MEHKLHAVYLANARFVYPFDGRTSKVAVALRNHDLVTAAVSGPEGASGAALVEVYEVP